MRNLSKLLVLSLLLNMTFLLHGQQNTYTKVLFDTIDGIKANSVVQTFDNSYLIAGESSYKKGIIIKIDSASSILWNKTFSYNYTPTNSYTAFNNIIRTKDSCFVIVGSIKDSLNAPLKALCIKISPSGDTLWTKSIRLTSGDLKLLSVQQTFDSGYVMTGYSQYSPDTKVFVAKLDFQGNLQWSSLLSTVNYYNIGYAIKQAADSGYIIVGHTVGSTLSENNAFLIKLSSQGNFLWA